MATFNIDGLIYTDKLPHSRIERLLYQILKKEGGGGGGEDVTLVVDDPDDVDNGLKIDSNKLAIDAANHVTTYSNLPATSGSVYEQIELADTILLRV